MSGLNPPPAAEEHRVLPSIAREGHEPGSRAWLRASLEDLGVVVAWSVGLGLLAAVVWWQVTPLAEYTRTKDAASMGEQELAKQVGADGWFFVVTLVAGLLSGVILVWWRSRDPLLMVVLVALGGALATWVMIVSGEALGPPDPRTALALVPVGTKVPLQLAVEATGLYASWSVAALLGAIGVIWGSERR